MRKSAFQCVLWHLITGNTPKIVMCAHLTMMGLYAQYILILPFIWFYGRQDIINQIMETKRIFMAEFRWQ